jgi:signal peptidase II
VTRYALFIPALLILVADQITKAWVMATLPQGHSVPVVGRILMLTHVWNSGTAFGLLRGSGTLLTVVSVAAVIFIVGYWFRLHARGEAPGPVLLGGLSLPLGGALGNLVDRLRYGHVVDFIDFRVWPVFNVADMAICTGAALIAFYFFVHHEAPGVRREASVQRQTHPPPERPNAQTCTPSSSRSAPSRSTPTASC